MWDLPKQIASKLSLRRRVSLLITVVILAAFAVVGPLMKPANAAPGGASWKGDTLQYDSHDYSATTAAPDQGTKTEYQWIDSSATPQYAYVLYFDGDAKTAKSASLIMYTYDPPSKYTDPSSATTITVTPAGTTDPDDTSTSESSCNAQYFGGVGWIVCSVSTWIANGVDGIYDLIKQFLEVNTITQSDNGVFQIWQMMLSLANIIFIIIFIIIVYSHLTSIGISNYSIKDMVPRLIIAAILVNFSFWICQFFVDISNVLGYSIQALFMNITQSLNITVDIAWTDITTVILSGGTIATGALTFAASTGGSFASLGFILLGGLISAGLAVLVAFVILAARQAIIVILVMLAPLAFVAMVLPSTKEWFDKWRKTFQTLLLFFPIFSMLFGGSQLAGTAIIKSQEGTPVDISHIAVVLIGLAVQVVPLFITPLILQFSQGLLGRIAGLANDRKRGIVDRAKNWTQSNAEDFKMRKLANAAERRGQQRPNESRLARALRQGRPSNLGLALDQSKRNRERRISRNGDYLANRSEAGEMQNINDPHNSPFGTREFNARQRQRMLDSHEFHERAADYKKEIDSEGREHMARLRQNDVQLNAMRRRTALNEGRADVVEKDMKAYDELAVQSMISRDQTLRRQAVRTKIRENEASSYQAAIAAEGDEAWKNREQNTGYLRVMRSNTELAKKRTADIDASMSAIDQRTYDTAVNEAATPQYARIRDMKVQTTVNQKQAQFQAGQVEAAGEREYNRAFEDGVTTTFTDAAGNTRTIRSRDLRQQNVATEQLKKESGAISNTLQKRADAHWERVSTGDARVQAIRLNEMAASESEERAKTEWEFFTENVREEGANAAGILGSNQALASSIHSDHEAAEQVEQATKKIKDISHSNSEREFLESTQGRELNARARVASGNKDIVEDEVKREFIESEEGQRLNLSTHAAKDQLEAAEAEESARIQELRTEKGAENLTDPEEIQRAQELREADIIKRAQNQRNANATTTANVEYAKQALDDAVIPGGTEKITTIAGGIAGKPGISQAQATAKQTVVEDFKKGVAAEKTLISQVPEKELLDILDDPAILDEPDEKISAIGGTIANRRHMASHIKLWGRIGQLGANAQGDLSGAEAALETAKSSGTPTDIEAAQKRYDDAKSRLSKVKDLQQQVMGDKSKTPFGVSDANQGDANVGQYSGNIYASTRDRISTHLSADKLAHMDPDDIRMIFEMARAGKLSNGELDKVKTAYDEWKDDVNLKSLLEDKHRRLLDPIVNNMEDTSGYPYDPDPDTLWGDKFEDIRNDEVLSKPKKD